MVASQGIPHQHEKPERGLVSEELIDRMARDMRAKGDPDFPHSYYVAQVRHRLAGKPSQMPPTDDGPDIPPPGAKAYSSVFHAWALAE
ncbi:hypothetical protein ACQKKX_03205 [Neorhizobium sp. NPDC001467]|uniref:hypothetical protein n=1 Tax=Neorhizobium sp. NPDC001467 TaxID=3390595 RepID=UPI003D0553AF